MTREEFEVLMDADGWTADQKYKWRDYTPACDRSTFYREMAKPNGVIEITKNAMPGVSQWWVWSRFFEKAAFALDHDRLPDGFIAEPSDGKGRTHFHGMTKN